VKPAKKTENILDQLIFFPANDFIENMSRNCLL